VGVESLSVKIPIADILNACILTVLQRHHWADLYNVTQQVTTMMRETDGLTDSGV
jgi:hypothetical protein